MDSPSAIRGLIAALNMLDDYLNAVDRTTLRDEQCDYIDQQIDLNASLRNWLEVHLDGAEYGDGPTAILAHSCER